MGNKDIWAGLKSKNKLENLKKVIDKTPDKFIKYHYDWSIKDEEFELSAYIRDVAKKRGINLS